MHNNHNKPNLQIRPASGKKLLNENAKKNILGNNYSSKTNNLNLINDNKKDDINNIISNNNKKEDKNNVISNNNKNSTNKIPTNTKYGKSNLIMKIDEYVLKKAMKEFKTIIEIIFIIIYIFF